MADKNIILIPFQETFGPDFKQLNLEWLERFDLLEPEDFKYLDHPKRYILDPGGRILFALYDEKVIGTCAIIRVNHQTAELAKLAVSPDFHRIGAGRILTEKSIQLAREMGFKKMILVSNNKLAAAVRLYESLGFAHKPMPDEIIYETADVYMELVIG